MSDLPLDLALVASVRDLLDFWSSIVRMERVDSWQRLFADVFREAHRRALRLWPEMVEGTVRCLLNMLLVPGCESKDAASRIIEVCHRILQTYSPTFGTSLDFALDALNVDKTALENSEFDYYRDRIRYGIGIDKMIVVGAFQKVDETLLKVLVKYGLALRPDVRADSFWIEWWAILKHVSRGRTADDWMFQLAEELLENYRTRSRYQRGWNRLPLIIRSLEAARMTLRGDVQSGETYARMLKAYSDTLPDPLVAEEEVRDFMLQEEHHDPEEVERMTRAFRGLFGQREYAPRRLQHLARCAVRETVVRNSPVTLPAAVGRARLPKVIKDVILCSGRLNAHLRN